MRRAVVTLAARLPRAAYPAGGWRNRASVAWVSAARIALAVAVAFALNAAGASANRLVQLSGNAGCLLNVQVAGCTQADVGNPFDVVVRDTHVYVSSYGDNRIRIYDRNTATGALTPRPAGLAGCVADDGGATGCADARQLKTPTRMAMNAAGTRLFVITVGNNGISVFNREPATGNLTQENVTSACVTASGDGGLCMSAAQILGEPVGVAVSLDGADVYVAGVAIGSPNGYVALFDVVAGGLAPHAPAAGGCAVDVAVAGCLDARAMRNADGVAIPPDGKHVYVTSSAEPGGNAVAVFGRDAATGALSLVAGEDGCLQKTGGDATCRATGLIGVETFPITFASNTRGYVGGIAGGYITLLARDPATGGLTAPGPCASSQTAGPLGSCSDVTDLFGLTDLVVLPNGSGLIGGSRYGRGMHSFLIGADGGPTLVAPPAGCLATGGNGPQTPCTIPRGFARVFGQQFGPGSIAVSDDGRFVYGVTPQDAEDRAGILAAKLDTAAPACQSATLSMQGGSQVALPLTCTDADGDAITLTVLTVPSRGVTGAAAGTSVPYAAPTDFDGTETLTYKGTANGVDSATATVTIQIAKLPAVALPPPPPAPRPPPPAVLRITSAVNYGWRFTRTRTRITSLSAEDIPAGAKIELVCTGKKGRCPFTKLSKSFKKETAKSGLLSLIKKSRRSFRVGAKLEVRITAVGAIGKSVKFTMRANRIPSVAKGCLPVGSSKAQKTCKA